MRDSRSSTLKKPVPLAQTQRRSRMYDQASRALSWAHVAVFRLQGSAQVAMLRLQHGQGLAEYALILSLIAIVAIVALFFLGGSISTILSSVGSSV